MRRKIIPYNPKLKERAKKLRKNMTQTEIMLWLELRGKKMRGYDFDRQRPIHNYIVDFYCKDLMLALEVDGESHYGNEKKDIKRQRKIESYGVRFLRFDDMEVRYKMEKVLEKIGNWIDENKR